MISSIEKELTAEIMAILERENTKVAVMVAAMVLIRCLKAAVERDDTDGAIAMLNEAMQIAEMMRRKQ